MSGSAWIEKVETASGPRWRARWRQNGHKGSATFRRKSEAALFIRDRVNPALAAGKPVGGYKVTLGEFLTEFWGWYEGTNLAPGTKAWMRSQLKLPSKRWRRFPLESLTARHMEEMLAERAASTNKQSTVNAYRKALNRAFNKAVAWGYIDRSPLVGVETPKVARQAAASTVVTELREEEHELTPAYVPSRAVVHKMAELMGARCPDYGDMVLVAAGSGMRFGELAGCAPMDFDLDAQIVQVRRTLSEVPKSLSVTGESKELKGTKTYEGRRDTDLAPGLVPRLKEICASRPRDQVLFRAPEGGLISRGAWGNAWRAAREELEAWCREVGEVMPVDFTLHSLRHYYASRLVSAGVPIPEVARQLGHKDPAFTLRVYSHWVPEDRDQVRAALVGLL